MGGALPAFRQDLLYMSGVGVVVITCRGLKLISKPFFSDAERVKHTVDGRNPAVSPVEVGSLIP